jgi:hypothetical protein
VQPQLRIAPGGSIGDYTHQGTRFEIKPRTRPQGAKHGFRRDLAEFLPHRVGLNTLIHPLSKSLAHELAA